jgi:hypothetical protein
VSRRDFTCSPLTAYCSLSSCLVAGCSCTKVADTFKQVAGIRGLFSGELSSR